MCRVLIVDDSDEVARPMQRLIQMMGVECQRESCGECGVTTAKQWHPDLVLLDIMMPDIDGIEVLRQLRRDGFENPIVMISALNDSQVKRYARIMGASDYITKGKIDRQSLAELIAKFVPGCEGLALELLPERQQEAPCLQHLLAAVGK